MKGFIPTYSLKNLEHKGCIGIVRKSHISSVEIIRRFVFSDDGRIYLNSSGDTAIYYAVANVKGILMRITEIYKDREELKKEIKKLL